MKHKMKFMERETEYTTSQQKSVNGGVPCVVTTKGDNMADFDFIVPVRDAILQHQKGYSNLGSDYSASELITPPKIVHLRKRYKDIIPLSVPSDQLASFLGTAIHDYFEKCLFRVKSRQGEDSKYIIEKRLWDKFLDRKISGKFDVYHDGTLYDFKKTSAWKWIFGDFQDWEEQLNIYAYFIYLEKLPINAARIIAIILDWDKNKLRDRNYPKEMIMQLDVPVWTPEKQKAFIYTKLQVLINCEGLPDNKLPDCSDKDMWAKETAYAIYYQDVDKAKRVLPDEDSCCRWIADDIAKKNTKLLDYRIVKRPGKRLRCEEYCSVRGWCEQYRNYRKGL
jgi:hypothetical protein